MDFATHQTIRIPGSAVAPGLGLVLLVVTCRATNRRYLPGILLLNIGAAISLVGTVTRRNEAITFTPEGTATGILAVIGMVLVFTAWRRSP